MTTITVRYCIRCKQPITFDWFELPVVDNRDAMHVVATFYVHPNTAACDDDVALSRRIEAGEKPAPNDMAMQRAVFLRNCVAAAHYPMLDQPIGAPA